MSLAEPRLQPQAVADPPPVCAVPAWPACVVPTADEAERAIRATLDAPPAPAQADFRPPEFSDLERAAFAGEADEVTAPFRAAAVLRWRLAVALSAVPPPGSAIDLAAATALVGDCDVVLKALVVEEGTPEPLVAMLAAIRDAVLRDALELNSVLHRFADAAENAAAAAAAAPAQRPVSAVKVLSVDTGNDAIEASRPRGRGAWVAFALAVAVAVGYHGWNYYERTQPGMTEAQNVRGAPPGMRGGIDPRSGVRTLVAEPGKAPTRAALDQFAADERVNGRVVRELAPGMIVSIPASAAASDGGTP